MASLKVTKAGWEVELTIPDDEEVMHDLRYTTMFDIVTRAFQVIAADADLTTDQRVNQLDAVGDLLLEIQAAQAAALPGLEISPSI